MLVVSYHNVANKAVSFDAATRQEQLINDSFKIKCVPYENPNDNSLSCSVL